MGGVHSRNRHNKKQPESARGGGDDEIEPEASGVSHKIDEKIHADRKKAAQFVKLLLLGSGESGKSTIFKQMKILHNSGFTDNERRELIPIIRNHVMENLADLVKGAKKLELLTQEQEDRAQFLVETVENLGFVQTVTSGILELWNSESLQAAYNRRDEFQLADSAALFFNDLPKITGAHYLPPDDHVLACRVRSTGVSEMIFVINHTKFRMVDVGGQKNERRKWINFFDDVNAIIFVVAISEYNQTMFEDENTNRIHDALALFDEIVNKTKCFENTTVILFLNKRDLFEEKAQKVDLNVCFPEYDGGCDEDIATAFMEHKFKSVRKQRSPLGGEVYCHVTCATNTDNMRFVFDAVKDAMVVSGALAAGML